MKNFFLLTMLTIFQAIAYGQWTELHSGTTEDLNKVVFISESAGYIVGKNGTMLKTLDGGNNWNSLNTGTSENLVSLSFINTDIGYIGGESGFISKTTDGGITWRAINLNLNTNVEIYFINNLVGFIGTANTIYRTTNGGVDWIESDLKGVSNFNLIHEIEFLTDSLGYALNRLGILRSVDGGKTWIQIIDDSHPEYNGANILSSVEFISEKVAHFGSVYYLGLYTTEDGGESLIYNALEISALEFPTIEIGYAIEGTDRLNVIKTLDRGKNWTPIFSEDNSIRLTDLHFVAKDKGWVIGHDGKIYRTNNGGIKTSIIDEEIDIINIQVYPNPTKNELTITLQGETSKKIKSIELLNSNGGKIYTAVVDDRDVTIQLKDLSSSLYFVIIYFETGQSIMKKVIIE